MKKLHYFSLFTALTKPMCFLGSPVRRNGNRGCENDSGEHITYLKLLLLTFFCIFVTHSYAKAPEEKKLLIYNWEEYLPQDVLDEFEKETNIHVVYDVFDSNEILEARLLSGPSGYDVVFPSSSPFFSRQLAAGAFLKLDKAKLPNLKDVSPTLLKLLEKVDPGNLYGIPYLWGTSGFAYNKEKIEQLMPDAPKNSLAMLMDPNVVRRFSKCGVSLMEQASDVFDAALLYANRPPNPASVEELELAKKVLQAVRPYMSKFITFQVVAELSNGDLCLSQCFSLEAFLAQQRTKEAKQPFKIFYTTPKEGTEIWCDMMAIPHDAPHPNNAHVFMNFLLRPEIMARITNATYAANPVDKSKLWIDEKIRDSAIIYPELSKLPNIYVQKFAPREIEKHRLRLWLQFKAMR